MLSDVTVQKEKFGNEETKKTLVLSFKMVEYQGTFELQPGHKKSVAFEFIQLDLVAGF